MRATKAAPAGGALDEVMRKKALIATLAAAHGARSVMLFGSAARGRKVDVAMPQSLKPRVRESALRDAVRIV